MKTLKPITTNKLISFGKYEPISEKSAGEFVYPGMIIDVSASTTDAEIQALAAKYERLANKQGYTLANIAETIMIEYRDELKANNQGDLCEQS